MATNCILTDQGGSSKNLVDNIPFVIGLNDISDKDNKDISKEHIQLTAHYKHRIISAVLLGKVNCLLGNHVVSRKTGEISVPALKNGELRLRLTLKDHEFKIKFTNASACHPLTNKISEPLNKNNDHSKKRKHDNDSTTQKAKRQSITNKIKPGWTKNESMLYFVPNGCVQTNKVAAFDVDSTIICTKSGKKFPIDHNDWRILYSQIPNVLKSLHNDGYMILFITNQLGITTGHITENNFKIKAENIVKDLNLPIQVTASTVKDIFRKPAPGIWNYFTSLHPDLDANASFYCGDAAGRVKDYYPGCKKDFSCADRLFAMNVDLKFYTPEEYFLKKPKAKFALPEFNPKKLDLSKNLLEPPSSVLIPNHKEIVIFVGIQASGKSTFYKNYLKENDYVIVSRDLLKTWQKCVTYCKEVLQNGHSVCIDNTSGDLESRKRYLEIAKEKSIPCRCFQFNTTFSHAQHNEKFRMITKENHVHINIMLMYSYRKNFVEPKLSEGFSEIVKVNFLPKFTDSKMCKLYNMFLCEK